MKKILLICSIVLATISTTFGQAKKPTIMVVPSDNWCIKNGYFIEFDNQGTKIKIPDYKKALQEDTDVLLVISAINNMMTERGFPLKNLESVLKTLESNAAEDNMMTSKDSGSDIEETPMDKLKQVAKADIIMQLTWTVNTTGPKKSVTFILQGLDAYTDKQIAGAQGTGDPSFTAETPVLLQEAVTAHIDNFNASLQTHFEDMFENGREVIIKIQRWSNWEHDLESEFNGEELSYIIEEWIAANTVKNRFSVLDATENMMVFEQVRMPLYNAKGRALDTRGFARELSKFLSEMGIPNKVTVKGLGRATIILGGK
ncbi:MAG: DUF6175 family protein [Vicingaceae bacterium]|nr:DUF6175 family protein [Vicingaceae bacterium]